jgi:excinuclease ABC subunit C
MQKTDLKKYNLPDSPGIYFFMKNEKVLYIGKATSLKDRVKSYFSADLISTRGSRIVDMITDSNNLKFQTTDSVLEALILESALIKKYKPTANIREKDNKSYYSVVITKEEFPRILIIRDKDLKTGTGEAENLKIKKTFGPFPNSAQLKEALKIIRKIFPFIDTNKPVHELRDIDKKRIRLNIEIGIFPDIFSGKTSKQEYLKNIQNIDLFFQGKKKQVLRNLEKEMSELSKKQEFEKAEKNKRKIFALNHIKDVSLIKKEINDEIDSFRIEAYDVAHLGGKNTVGVFTVIENSYIKKNDYRLFNIKSAKEHDDYGALTEILNRRFNHPEWTLPNLIVIDGGIQHKNTAEKVLNNLKIKIDVVAVVKDDSHKPKDILGDKEIIKKYKEQILLANNESHRFALSNQKKKRKII